MGLRSVLNHFQYRYRILQPFEEDRLTPPRGSTCSPPLTESLPFPSLACPTVLKGGKCAYNNLQ